MSKTTNTVEKLKQIQRAANADNELSLLPVINLLKQRKVYAVMITAGSFPLEAEQEAVKAFDYCGEQIKKYLNLD